MENLKKCSKCKEFKDKSDFNRNIKTKDGLQYYCKDCNKSNVKNHYTNNKSKYIDKSKKYKKKIWKIVDDIKSSSGCKICGYNRCTASLDFHHKESNSKDGSVGRLIGDGNLSKVLEEISKCVIVCKNCHYEIHSGLTKI